MLEPKEPEVIVRHSQDHTPRTLEVMKILTDMVGCMSPGTADTFTKELARGVAIGMVNGISYSKQPEYDHLEKLYNLSRI